MAESTLNFRVTGRYVARFNGVVEIMVIKKHNASMLGEGWAKVSWYCSSRGKVNVLHKSRCHEIPINRQRIPA